MLIHDDAYITKWKMGHCPINQRAHLQRWLQEHLTTCHLCHMTNLLIYLHVKVSTMMLPLMNTMEHVKECLRITSEWPFCNCRTAQSTLSHCRAKPALKEKKEEKSTKPKKMDVSPFGRLPGELRNRIYHYFFATQLASPIQIDIRPAPRDGGARLKNSRAKTRSALALTAASRQLRHETLALFWSTATLRIVAETLTTHSHPVDEVPGVHPINRAHHINEDRIDILKVWLWQCKLDKQANSLHQPIELDLGTWDPHINVHNHQRIILDLMAREAAGLLEPLHNLQKHVAVTAPNKAAEKAVDITLRFSVRVKADTALGPIRVCNEREQALAAVGELCAGRMATIQAQFQNGLLTPYGRSVLSHDLAMCKSVAEIFVQHVVAKDEDEDEDEGESESGVRGGSGGGGAGKVSRRRRGG